MLSNHVYDKLMSFAIADGLKLENTSILVALSGGLDSIVLAHILIRIQKECNFNLAFAHVNHGLRPEATEDQQFCIDYAASQNLEIHSTRLDSESCTGSVENWGRTNRYQYLYDLCRDFGYDWCLTAHHQDDQIETIFMRSLKNAAWPSLVGIREINGRIRRTMLSVSKQQIKDYAEDNQLEWVEDHSNLDTRLLRNEIRHRLLPDALKKDPDLIKKLLDTAAESLKRLQAATEKMQQLVDKYAVNSGNDFPEIQFDISEIIKLTEDETVILIQKLVKMLNDSDYISVTAGHWYSFCQFMKKSDTGTVFDLAAGVSCLKNRDRLIIYNPETFIGIEKVQLIPGEEMIWYDTVFEWCDLENPSGVSDKQVLEISRDQAVKGIFARNWQHGDKMLSYNMNKMVKLSDLFSNNQLSYLEKIKQPVVQDESGRIIWVPGLAHAADIETGVEKVKILWRKK